jgi:SAM-dependent methyltransferase
MSPQGGDVSRTEARAKLLEHFKGRENEPSAWDELWKENEFLPWDRGLPNPALVDVLNDRKDLIGDPTDGMRRKKALVPGCGKGYDCLLLASYGYDAFGLEVSSHAVREAEKWKADHEKDYVVKDEAIGRGQVKFVCGDFFAEDWLKNIFGSENQDQGCFDLIYDYTVGCF